jgi:hypothetical protein
MWRSENNTIKHESLGKENELLKSSFIIVVGLSVRLLVPIYFLAIVSSCYRAVVSAANADINVSS